MITAPPRITAAAIIAAVDAGQVFPFPRPMTHAERREAAHAMRHFVQRDDLTVSEAGAKIGLRSYEHAVKCARTIGLGSSPTAVKRVRNANLQGSIRVRTGDRSANPSPQRMTRDALDDRIQELRLAGKTRPQIAEALGIGSGRVDDGCKRKGRLPRKHRDGDWDALEREREERAQAARKARADLAERLRELAKTMPVRHAAEALGISVRVGERLASEYRIRSEVRVVPPRRAPGPFHGLVRKWVDDPSKMAPPNPLKSKAQQENIDRMKRHTGWLIAGSVSRVPPISREEADRLVAEAIAAGKVTKCPTMFAAPVNNGTGIAPAPAPAPAPAVAPVALPKPPPPLITGEDHPAAKLTVEKVRAIRERAEKGEMGSRLAAEYGVAATKISQIVLRKSWRHVE